MNWIDLEKEPRIGVPSPYLEPNGVPYGEGGSELLVSAYSKANLEGAIRPVIPPGTRVRTPIPLERYHASVIEQELPQFEGWTRFCMSPGDVDDMVFSLQSIQGALGAFELDGGVLDAENDVIKKATLLNGRTGWEHYSPEGVTNDSEITIPSLPAVGRWFDKLHRKFRKWGKPDLKMTVKRGTNHGWPTWVSGNDLSRNDDDLAAHMFMSVLLAKNDGDINRTGEQISKIAAAPLPEPCATMFFRTGPYGKPHVMYDQSPDGPIPAGISVGKFCRQRQVFGVQAWVNLYLRPKSVEVKYTLWSDHSFRHTTAAARLAFLNANFAGWDWFSEDISGYDRSVSRTMQEDLADHVWSVVMDDNELRCYKQVQDMPVLAPGLFGKEKESFLYSRSGMTISGSIFTTNDGSVLNFARIVHCLGVAMGKTADDVISGKDLWWTTMILGDDCVIGLSPQARSTFSHEKYNQANEEIGFTTTLFRGIVFLSTVFDLERRTTYNLISRCISNTYAREYPSATLEIDLLGAYSRWSKARSHPMFNLGWGFISQHRVFKEMGIKTLSQLGSLVYTEGFQRKIIESGRQLEGRKSLASFLDSVMRGEERIEDTAYYSALASMSGLHEFQSSRTTDMNRLLEGMRSVRSNDIMDFIREAANGRAPKIFLSDRFSLNI